MEANRNFSVHVKAPLHRTRSKTTHAKFKILTAIEEQASMDFTEIDIYKFLHAKQEKISIYTVTNNLKQLIDTGFLVSNKTNVAARLYKKSGNFKELLAGAEFKPYLFNVS